MHEWLSLGSSLNYVGSVGLKEVSRMLNPSTAKPKKVRVLGDALGSEPCCFTVRGRQLMILQLRRLNELRGF